MTYITAAEAAKLWNVSLRAVQKWAKEGKISGATKIGRDWNIPENSINPLNKTSPSEKIVTIEESCSITMPLMNGAFQPGNAKKYIKSLGNQNSKNVATAEYYYFSGQAQNASKQAETAINCNDKSIRLSALLVHSFSNIALGNTKIAKQDFDAIQLSIMEENTTEVEKAIAIFISSMTVVLLHDINNEPLQLESFVKYLPNGMKLYSFYALAHLWYLKGDYSRSLGIAESGLAMLNNCYPISIIYLNLISAMDSMNLQQTERGKEYFDKAWNMAKKDNFLQPFAEHHGLLQGLIESQLKRSEPELYKKIIDITGQFSNGWRKLHNTSTNETIADGLTTTEFSIAMLVNKKWTISRIAAHLQFSERTVKNYIACIYQKLGIKNRSDLKKHMLK